MKFRTYDGETLENVEVSFKIDGVRAHLVDGKVLSRANKPLYNIEMNCEVAEIFCESWEKTVSMVRTMVGEKVPDECVYSLDPLDPRLLIGKFDRIDSTKVQELYENARRNNYEGIIIKTNKYLYKVKEKSTEDVKVLAIQMGTGKYQGKMGALITPKGKVGTGFTDKEREELLNIEIGSIIEVESMGLTPSGKFRHPRFLRLRFDKE